MKFKTLPQKYDYEEYINDDTIGCLGCFIFIPAAIVFIGVWLKSFFILALIAAIIHIVVAFFILYYLLIEWPTTRANQYKEEFERAAHEITLKNDDLAYGVLSSLAALNEYIKRLEMTVESDSLQITKLKKDVCWAETEYVYSYVYEENGYKNLDNLHMAALLFSLNDKLIEDGGWQIAEYKYNEDSIIAKLERIGGFSEWELKEQKELNLI